MVDKVVGPVAAAVDGQINLHVAHILETGRAVVAYDFVDDIGDTGWTTVDLYNKNNVVELDIGAQPRGNSIPWYVLYATSAKGTIPHVVEGRMTTSTSGKDVSYGAGKPCERQPKAASLPSVAVAYHAANNEEWAATSFFGDFLSSSNLGWKLSHYPESGWMSKCFPPASVDCVSCPKHPGRLAVDTSGGVHLALSRTGKPRGTLFYARWSGSSTSPPREEGVLKEPSVDPKSLDIDVDEKGQPCIAFFAGGMITQAALRVACLRVVGGKSEWSYSTTIVKVNPKAYSAMEAAHATAARIAIGRDKGAKMIHVAFTTMDSAPGSSPSLKYVTCALP